MHVKNLRTNDYIHFIMIYICTGEPTSGDGDGDGDIGTIVGSVIGGTVFVIFIVILSIITVAYWKCRRNDNNRRRKYKLHMYICDVLHGHRFLALQYGSVIHMDTAILSIQYMHYNMILHQANIDIRRCVC